MKATSGATVTLWERRLAGRSKAWLSDVIASFWMPDCCWQLGLGPLVSRNQEGLHRLSPRSTLLRVSASVGGLGEGLHYEVRCLGCTELVPVLRNWLSIWWCSLGFPHFHAFAFSDLPFFRPSPFSHSCFRLFRLASGVCLSNLRFSRLRLFRPPPF